MGFAQRIILFLIFLGAGVGVFFWLGDWTHLAIFLVAGVLAQFGFAQVLGFLTVMVMGFSLILSLFLGINIIPLSPIMFIVVGAAGGLMAASGFFQGMLN